MDYKLHKVKNQGDDDMSALEHGRQVIRELGRRYAETGPIESAELGGLDINQEYLPGKNYSEIDTLYTNITLRVTE